MSFGMADVFIEKENKMTVEQTYEYFKEMVDGCGAYELCPCFKDDMEMTKIAFSALEKQIPKNVFTSYGEAYCPSCRIKIDFGWLNKFRYCNKCGQALDWSETE